MHALIPTGVPKRWFYIKSNHTKKVTFGGGIAIQYQEEETSEDWGRGTYSSNTANDRGTSCCVSVKYLFGFSTCARISVLSVYSPSGNCTGNKRKRKRSKRSRVLVCM